MKIGKTEISAQRHPFLIAEVGISHKGSFEAAQTAIHAALGAGFDAVKFQHYSEDATSFPTGGGVRMERFRAARFSDLQIERLMAYTRQLGGLFICTARDEYALEVLTRMGVDAIKLGSGSPILGSTNLSTFSIPLIISLGMINDNSVGLLPQRAALLHCVSAYPTEDGDANLERITHLKERFTQLIGYSDHTVGGNACAYATILGARIIEKHIYLTEWDGGQDYGGALQNKRELISFVSHLKGAHRMMGVGHKEKMLACEEKTAAWAIHGGEKPGKDGLLSGD